MNLLAGLKTSNDIAEDKDVLGGGYKVLDTDIYTGKLKYAYIQKAQSSQSLALNVAIDIDGFEYTESLRLTNKQNENFYVKDGQKNYLPGFTNANALALFTAGKELSDLKTENKVIELYDYTQKQKVPTAVPCLVELHGKEVTVAIQKENRPKQEKDAAGNYVDTAEMRNTNAIVKVFSPTSHKTVAEVKAKADAAEFYDKWLEQNKGKVREIKPKGAVAAAASGTKNASVSSLFSS